MSVVTAKSADGLKIVGEDFGPEDGPPVLLLAGTNMVRGLWAMPVAGLVDRFRCITLDSRDVGDSDRDSKQYDSATMADDAVAVLDEFGVARAQVAGFSLGGCVALQVALHHPDRVTSVCTGSCWARVDAHLRYQFQYWIDLVEVGGWDMLFKLMMFMSFSNETLELMGDGLLALGASMAEQFDPEVSRRQVTVDATHNLSDEELGRIKVPLLSLWGTEDLLVPRKHAEMLAKAVPNAEIGAVEGVSHALTVDHPERYTEILRTWFERHA